MEKIITKPGLEPILEKIFKHLDLSTLSTCLSVTKYWNKVVQNWRTECEEIEVKNQRNKENSKIKPIENMSLSEFISKNKNSSTVVVNMKNALSLIKTSILGKISLKNRDRHVIKF